MKKHSIISAMLLISMGSMAQAISYSYDAAGNRVKREIVIQRSPSRSPMDLNHYTDNMSDGLRVKIYPSDGGFLRVVVIGNGSITDCIVEVYNTSGMKLNAKAIENGQALIDLSNYRNGVYILRINVNDKQTSWKITKK